MFPNHVGMPVDHNLTFSARLASGTSDLSQLRYVSGVSSYVYLMEDISQCCVAVALSGHCTQQHDFTIFHHFLELDAFSHFVIDESL